MAVSRRLRYEILRRDNHRCRYCGASAPDVKLTVDHVTPTALGGTDDPGNLVAACADCNSGKSATPPGAPLVADVAADALRWAAAMRTVTTAALADRAERLRAVNSLGRYWDDLRGKHRVFGPIAPDDWWQTVDRWLSAGLTVEDVADAMLTAMVNRRIADENVWRYCCGIAWGTLTERQEAARAMLRTEGA